MWILIQPRVNDGVDVRACVRACVDEGVILSLFLEINTKCFRAGLLSLPSPQTQAAARFEALRPFCRNQPGSTGKVRVSFTAYIIRGRLKKERKRLVFFSKVVKQSYNCISDNIHI